MIKSTQSEKVENQSFPLPKLYC